MNQIFITKQNYKELSQIVEKAIKGGAKLVSLRLANDPKLQIKFKTLIPHLYKALDWETYLKISIQDIPFCVIPGGQDHIVPNFSFENQNKKKFSFCGNCRYFLRCQGIFKSYLNRFGSSEFQPIKDLPREIMIEVEPGCNFNCRFCFNKNSFARYGRNIQSMNSSYVKEIIKSMGKAEIKIVRFTGGEPLLRKDIFDLMKFAKNQGLKVRLNTNASLIDEKMAKKLKGLVNSVLIPIHSYNDQKESLITESPGSLRKKIKAIQLLKKHRIGTVRAGTVVDGENIKDLEKIFRLVQKLKLDDWEVYRPIPTPGNKNPVSKSAIRVLIEKLIKFNKMGQLVKIVNGIPFCVYNRNKVNSVSTGSMAVDGHIRFVADPRGFAKPDYYHEINLGDPRNVLKVWNNPFLVKMRSLAFLPRSCRSCFFAEKCRGGNRFAAKMAFGQLNAPDPLMPLSKI